MHFLLHLPACWKISEPRFVACKCQPENSEGLLLLSFPRLKHGDECLKSVVSHQKQHQPQGWIVPPLAPPWRQGKFQSDIHNCCSFFPWFFQSLYFVVFKLTQVPGMIIVDYMNLNDKYSYWNFRHHSAICGTSSLYLFCWRRRKPCGLTSELWGNGMFLFAEPTFGSCVLLV